MSSTFFVLGPPYVNKGTDIAWLEPPGQQRQIHNLCMTNPLLSICSLLLVTWASLSFSMCFQIAMYLEQCGLDLFSFFIQILGVPSMNLSLKRGKPGKRKVFSFCTVPVLTPNSESTHSKLLQVVVVRNWCSHTRGAFLERNLVPFTKF